ncbi:hypothetical protein COB52_01455 [Candidatus Kaiserbacteria bacterium]|nr:MAG: hypothetical protein COB52_01455 [Candidatus Kaiserbacteria bacterium]
MTISTYRISIAIAVIAIAIASVLPYTAQAAYDDVKITTDVTISVNSVSMTIYGSTATIESLAVGASTFSFDLVEGSFLRVTSSGRKVMASNAAKSYVGTDVCSSTESILEHFIDSGSGGDSVTVTITPSASTCVGSAQSSSVVGGGGIISNSSASASAPVSAPVYTPATTNVVTPAAPTTYVWSRSLDIGAKGNDVMELQKFLNSNGFSVTASGAGSQGNETTYFGSATRTALAKYQEAKGISPAVGYFGPLTRASMKTGVTTTPVTTTPSSSGVSAMFSSSMDVGMSNSSIKRLQQLLNTSPDTQISTTGAGSPGNETEYFGSLTAKAVQKFQMKHGVAKPGDSGYGYVGPKTRAKLQEVFGNTTTPSTSSSTTMSALQAQISAALEQVKNLQEQLKSTQ